MNQMYDRILDILGIMRFSCPSCGTTIPIAPRSGEEIEHARETLPIKQCISSTGAISNFHAIVCHCGLVMFCIDEFSTLAGDLPPIEKASMRCAIDLSEEKN